MMIIDAVIQKCIRSYISLRTRGQPELLPSLAEQERAAPIYDKCQHSIGQQDSHQYATELQRKGMENR